MKPLPKKNDAAYKVGPNKVDQVKIKKMADEGVNAEEISQKLKIQLKSIKGWMPKGAEGEVDEEEKAAAEKKAATAAKRAATIAKNKAEKEAENNKED